MCHDAGVPVEGFDHIAITVADVGATIAWYQRVLGAEPLHLDLWREGKLPLAPSFSSWASAGKAGRSPGLDGNLLELLTLDGAT